MSFDLPPQRKLTLNKMALGVLQPRTGQTIGVRTLVFLYSYLYGSNEVCALSKILLSQYWNEVKDGALTRVYRICIACRPV